MKEFGNDPVTWLQLLIFVYGVMFICIIVFYVSKWHHKRKIKKGAKKN